MATRLARLLPYKGDKLPFLIDDCGLTVNSMYQLIIERRGRSVGPRGPGRRRTVKNFTGGGILRHSFEVDDALVLSMDPPAAVASCAPAASDPAAIAVVIDSAVTIPVVEDADASRPATANVAPSTADWRMPVSALATAVVPGPKAVQEFYRTQSTRARAFAAAREMLARRDAGGAIHTSEQGNSNEHINQRIIQLAFTMNVVLFLFKIAAAAYSGSITVIGSAIESSMDVFSGSILFVAARIARKRDPVRFPVGKARMEPLAIVIFASVMCMAALQLLVAAVQDILAGVSNGPSVIIVDALPIAALASAIVAKIVIVVLSWRFKSTSESVAALHKDAFNDVITNAAAIFAIVVASRVTSVWWLDPAFAIGLACMIVATWSVTIKASVYALSGESGACTAPAFTFTFGVLPVFIPPSATAS